MTTAAKKTAARAPKKSANTRPATRATKTRAERYTVAIDELVIVITGSKAGGYIVTCPFDPELVTQGRTLDEAVAMARDAQKTLAEARAKPVTRF